MPSTTAPTRERVAATMSDPGTSTAHRARTGTGALLATLASLTAIAPISSDMYVPGFPALAASLGTSASMVQLSLTANLVGLAIGQLVLGPVSDAKGRRPALLWGLAGWVLASLACAIAPDVTVLIAARLVQGLTGAAGLVVARAVVVDRFHGREVAQHLTMLSIVIGVAPVLAPVAGGLVLGVAGWRGVFVVLAGIGIALLIAVARAVPESLPADRRNSSSPRAVLGTAHALLSLRSFGGYVAMLGLSSVAFFAYIAGSPFVLQNVYGVSELAFSGIFAANATVMLVTSGLVGRLAGTVRLNTLLSIGVAVSTAAALVLLLTVSAGDAPLPVVWAGLALFTSGMGLIIPTAMTIGQGLGRASAGTASALLGGGQFLMGALASPLVGLMGQDSAAPMSMLMVIGMLATVTAALLLARPWRGDGELALDHADHHLEIAEAFSPES